LVVYVSQAGSNPAAAAEIANLRKEAHALKAIRESMGSPVFYQKVFEKVFKEDIERLRGMEDMWKTRTAPQPLDFETLQQESSSIEPIVSVNDQKVWSIAEDFVVFKDRSDTLPLQTIGEQ
jgi:ubiquitin-like 1-activating enzyme E1 B